MSPINKWLGFSTNRKQVADLDKILRPTPFWFGAVGDGVANDTQALIDWYAAIPTGGTGLIPDRSRFRFTAKLSWNRSVNVEGEGVGSCLFPDLNSAVTDAIVVNDTPNALVAYISIRNFSVLSSAVNACRDAFVCNRLNHSHVDVIVKTSAARYGTRLVSGLTSKWRILSSVNFAYPYAAGSPAADSVRIQYDAVNLMGFNNNDVELRIDGGNNGCWIEDQALQGNNRFWGCIQGAGGTGTRSFYAKSCIGIEWQDLHIEGCTVPAELDNCSVCQVQGGVQLIPPGAGGKLILTNSNRIQLDAVNLDILDVAANCFDIEVGLAFKGSITDPGGHVRRRLGARVGAVVNAPTAVAQSLFDVGTHAQGRFTVTVSGTNVGAAYMAIATVVFDGTNAALVAVINGANMTITLVGTVIKATQTSGGNLSFGWQVDF